jgi:hypothetical protein
MWTLDSIGRALGSAFAIPEPGVPPAAGFACEDTLALAGETIGFTAPGDGAGSGAGGAGGAGG